MKRTFGPDDERRMVELQRQVSDMMLRANRQGLSRIVAVFALTRCVRELLAGVDDGARNAIVGEVLIPFLQGEPPEGEGGKIILH